MKGCHVNEASASYQQRWRRLAAVSLVQQTNTNLTKQLKTILQAKKVVFQTPGYILGSDL